MTTAANSLTAQMVADVGSTAPPSFNGVEGLFLFNLVVMTGATFVAAMMVGVQLRDMWHNRRRDGRRDPLTTLRILILLFSTGITLRCMAEAMNLWGWDPNDPVLTARVMMAKRWLDPIAVTFGLAALAVAHMASPAMTEQLRKSPYPVEMLSRWPVLKRPAGVVLTIFIAALAAVVLR